MANICEYKIIVKGKKNACYAFMGSTSNAGGKEEDSWIGSDDFGELRFHGDCKWAIDSYCTPFEGTKPVELPSDFRDAENEGESKYWYNTVRERSEMFQVEVFCNSADIEDYDPDEGSYEIFEHYINGVEVEADCPEELRISGDEEDEDWDYEDDDEEEDEDDCYEMIVQMLKDGVRLDEIAKTTGVSKDEILYSLHFFGDDYLIKAVEPDMPVIDECVDELNYLVQVLSNYSEKQICKVVNSLGYPGDHMSIEYAAKKCRKRFLRDGGSTIMSFSGRSGYYTSGKDLDLFKAYVDTVISALLN